MSTLIAQLNWRRELPGDAFTLRASLSAGRGVTALYGRSGAGKTTVLRCVAGLERPPAAGNAVSFGELVWQDASRFVPARRRRVGYVFQEPRLFTHLSVQGNLDYARRRRPRAASVDDAEVIRQLGLESMLAQRADTLSGGQQRRVAIARALISAPAALLMDEPLSGLDFDAREDIMRYLRGLFAQLSMPVIYVSHSLQEIATLADQVAVIERGRTVAAGPVEDMLTRLGQPLSGAPDSMAVLRVTLLGHDAKDRLSEATPGGALRMVLPLCDQAVGETVRVLVPAKDVSIALDPPGRTSILNVLPARFEEATSLGDGHALARLALDGGGDAAASAGQRLLARITERSLKRLRLSPGGAVYAQVKAVALVR